jgi:tetratricopeptide (TPR) repeat protein
MTEGNLAAAGQAFEKALEISPDDRSAQKGLKDVQERLAREKAATDRDAQLRTHLKTGEAYLAAGRYGDARQEYEAALKLKPDDAKVAEGLQEAEIQGKLARGRQAQAVEAAEDRRRAEESEQLREAREDARRAEDARGRQEYLMALLQSRAAQPAASESPAQPAVSGFSPSPAGSGFSPAPAASGNPGLVKVTNTKVTNTKVNNHPILINPKFIDNHPKLINPKITNIRIR